MTPSEISVEKYVSLTTYRRDGSPKAVPVWIADLGDGEIGFTTELDSYKVKRIQNDDRVELRPCDMRGRVNEDEAAISGTARIVADGDAGPVNEAIAAKYGWQRRVMLLPGRIMAILGKDQPATCGVIIGCRP